LSGGYSPSLPPFFLLNKYDFASLKPEAKRNNLNRRKVLENTSYTVRVKYHSGWLPFSQPIRATFLVTCFYNNNLMNGRLITARKPITPNTKKIPKDIPTYSKKQSAISPTVPVNIILIIELLYYFLTPWSGLFENNLLNFDEIILKYKKESKLTLVLELVCSHLFHPFLHCTDDTLHHLKKHPPLLPSYSPHGKIQTIQYRVFFISIHHLSGENTYIAERYRVLQDKFYVLIIFILFFIYMRSRFFNGEYTIKARAKDTDNLWGPWGELKVTMPRYKATDNSIFYNILEQFPLLKQLFSIYFL